MRRIFLGVLALALLGTALASTAGAAPSATRSADHSATADRAAGLEVRFHSWGPLHLGMTHRQTWRTGMVTRKADRCAPGYRMKKRFQERGYIVWKGDFPKMKVKEIVIRGEGDATPRGTHVGSTLRKLRGTYGDRLHLRRGSALDGNRQGGDDLWVATVHKRRGALNFHFAYGPKPKPLSTVQYILISKKPAVYWGC